MSFIDKLGGLFSTEDEDDFEEEEAYAPAASRRETKRGLGQGEDEQPAMRREPMRRGEYGREAVRESLSVAAPRSESNVIAMPGKNMVERLTQKFKIVVVEPHSFDECRSSWTA